MDRSNSQFEAIPLGIAFAFSGLGFAVAGLPAL